MLEEEKKSFYLFIYLGQEDEKFKYSILTIT